MFLLRLILLSIHKSKRSLLKGPSSGLLNIIVYYLRELIHSPLKSSVCYSSKLFMNVYYMPGPALGSGIHRWISNGFNLKKFNNTFVCKALSHILFLFNLHNVFWYFTNNYIMVYWIMVYSELKCWRIRFFDDM